MPRHCSAAGCCTRDTRETRIRGISFHRLPKKDNPRRVLWLANCRRLDPSGQKIWNPVSEYIYFCSKHFEDDCFELVGISGYHRLKEGAVPTIFESSSHLQETLNANPQEYGSDSPDPTRLRRHRHNCSVDGTPSPENTTLENEPPPVDAPCFPEELPAPPVSLPALPPSPGPSGLGSPFSDLLEPLEPHGDEGSSRTPASPEQEPESEPKPPATQPVSPLAAQPVSPSAARPVSPSAARPVSPSVARSVSPSATRPASPSAVRPASPLAARPVSPSVYMLRLPPPAGAYIQNEHSYQVGSALLWKRRAEMALDALDKAQRQLQACKRREQRLRMRIARLQQERAREKRAQADAQQALKEHLEGFELQVSGPQGPAAQRPSLGASADLTG